MKPTNIRSKRHGKTLAALVCAFGLVTAGCSADNGGPDEPEDEGTTQADPADGDDTDQGGSDNAGGSDNGDSDAEESDGGDADSEAQAEADRGDYDPPTSEELCDLLPAEDVAEQVGFEADASPGEDDLDDPVMQSVACHYQNPADEAEEAVAVILFFEAEDGVWDGDQEGFDADATRFVDQEGMVPSLEAATQFDNGIREVAMRLQTEDEVTPEDLEPMMHDLLSALDQ